MSTSVSTSKNGDLSIVVIHDGWRIKARWDARGRLKDESVTPAKGAPAVAHDPGPGSHLKAIFEQIGFKPVKFCECNKIKSQMNKWGPDGCREPENLNWIVEGIQQEALKRGKWARALATGPVVRIAIEWACRKAESSH